MKIICSTSVLKEALQNVQRASAGKSTIEVLQGVLIRARSQKELFICGYNLEVGITTTVPAKIEEPSGFVIDPKLLIDILRKTDSQEISIVQDSSLKIFITAGESKYSIKALSEEDYPALPVVDDGKSISLQSSVLRKMIKQTVFAASLLDDSPVNTGTLFSIKDRMLTMVSVDGFRLAKTCTDLSIADSLKSAKFIVPAKTLSELVRLMPGEKDLETADVLENDSENKNGKSTKINDGGDTVNGTYGNVINDNFIDGKEIDQGDNPENSAVDVFFGEHHVVFTAFGYSVISRLLEGAFLDYDSAIPKNSSFSLKVNTKDLINSVDRVSVLIAERTKSPVRLKFSPGCLSLFCHSPIGKSEDHMSVSYSGDDFEIGFNSKYLLDALKNADTDLINLDFSGTLAPVKITPPDGDSFLFLVLPVRLVAE